MRRVARTGDQGRSGGLRRAASVRSLRLLGRHHGRHEHRPFGRIRPPQSERARPAGRLVPRLHERHAPRGVWRGPSRHTARTRRPGRGGCRDRGHAARQLRQERRHRQERDDFVRGTLQDGMLQPGRVVRELGVGDRGVQRRHIGRAPDQDARPGRHLHPDSRREPSDHARSERSLRPELHAGHVAQFDPGVEGRGFGHGRTRGHHGPDQSRTPQAHRRRAPVRQSLPRRRAAARGQHFDGFPRDPRQEVVERDHAPRVDGHPRARHGPQRRRLPRPAQVEPDQRGQPMALCGRQRSASPLGLEVCARKSFGRHGRLPQVALRSDAPERDNRQTALRLGDPQPRRQCLLQARHARGSRGLRRRGAGRDAFEHRFRG